MMKRLGHRVTRCRNLPLGGWTNQFHFFRVVDEDAATLLAFVFVALFATEPDVVTRCAKSCFAGDQLPVRVAALLANFITEDF
jgi:hypothetical protein